MVVFVSASPWPSATTLIVPEAVVLIPFSLNVSALGDGDGLGVGVTAAGLGEGDTEAVPPEPQAEADTASTTSATHPFKPAVSPQICSKRYTCRLLDAYRP